MALGHAIIFLSIPDESQKEKEKGTDLKFPGFRPYFLVNPLVLETNVVVASLVPRPPLYAHTFYNV